MKPYETVKLISSPDLGDIQAQGRRSGVTGKQRGTIKNKRQKALARRLIKRGDRMASERRYMKELREWEDL